MFRRAAHPGGVLKEELAELGITAAEFARQIRVPSNRISQIIAGKRALTADTALRFGHWFGTGAQFWLNLQSSHDLAVASEHSGPEIASLPVGPGTTGQPAT